MSRKGTSVRTIGHCIYCGRQGIALTDEHIIPFALGGNLKLDKASCGDCQKVTADVEGHVCRPITGMLRTRLGLQTRRPAKRVTIPQMVFFGEQRRTIECAPEDFPAVFSYPMFAKPGLVGGPASAGEYRTGKIWSLGRDKNFKLVADAFMARHGCTRLQLASFKPAMLMSFMAKVGHAAAVALLGPDGFEPLLAEAAIQPHRQFPDRLGGGGIFAPNPEVLHLIELRQVDGLNGPFIFARLSWFAFLTPDSTDPLGTDPGYGPPAFLGLVGRPVDDRLVGKLGQIEYKRDGTQECTLLALPDTGQFIPAPPRRPPFRPR